jgi:hypothetical protein
MKTRYTVVQHSAWAGKGDPQFRRAVEEAVVTEAIDHAKVKKAGGVLFTTYGEAADYAMEQNYPPEVKGITPRCRGTFARSKVGGRAIYVPSAKG